MTKKSISADTMLESLTSKLLADLNEFSEIRAFAEPMITRKRVKDRWPGLSPRWFAKGIDDVCDAQNPTVLADPDAMSDFPVPFFHLATVYDSKGKKITLCKSLEANPATGKAYKRPYDRIRNGNGYRYRYKRLLFRKSEVLEYEAKYPDIKVSNDSRDAVSSSKCNTQSLGIGVF